MSIAVFDRLLPPRFERLLDDWFDRERNGRATLILLALFVAAWTLFHIIANVSIDLHPDLTEVYAWSRHPSAGYYKHPPLAAFIAAAWFFLFPAADWSFYLLAMVNAAVALFAIDLIAQRYLGGDKRLFVLLLLLLTPFYQFHAERFSTNQTLLSTWPIATYCFLRAFESRNVAWAAAAGATAALAMLGKYYSIYLVASFIIAALTHPGRATYLKSASPWISVGVGLVVLAPHLYWLTATGFPPLAYAYAVHHATSVSGALRNVAAYLIGGVGYVAVLIAVYLLAVRPNRRTLVDALWPSDPNRRMLVVLLGSQLLLPPLTAPLLGLQITSLWTMSAWFLLPIVLLAGDSIRLPRARAVHVAIIVMLMALGSLIAAPAVALVHHAYGTKQGREYYRALSHEVTDEWRRATGRPLAIVLGHEELIGAVAFYSPDHPDSVPALWAAPWLKPERLERDGWAFVCWNRDPICKRHVETLLPDRVEIRRLEIEVIPQFLGRVGRAERFPVALVPPAKMQPQ